MFAYQDRRGAVEVAFTDRHGVPRGGPSASLDLSEPPEGAPDLDPDRTRLEQNLTAVGRALAEEVTEGAGATRSHSAETKAPAILRMRQVHGVAVHVVDRRARHGTLPVEPPVADALVTDVPGVALAVRVADCVPVLLADVERGVVGVAHAGRAGLVGGVVPAALARMRDLGAARLVAWVGPHVCGRCYEVPADLREQVAAVVPESFAETSWGTPAVDVGAGVTAQLVKADVEVVDAARCTLEDEALFSYRRDGVAAGRFAGLVWVRR